MITTLIGVSSSASNGTATGITAFAGGGQANATQLTVYDNNVTTVATAGDSVKLKAATAGARQKVWNNGANVMDIFPQSGENIVGLAADTAIPLGSGGAAILFTCFVDGEWQY
jgi:hypothetical protein